MEKAYDHSKRLTQKERAARRVVRVEDVNDFLVEMIQYCDDEEDIIAIGALLQVVSKNMLTSVMNSKDWKYIISRYLSDVDNQQEPVETAQTLLQHFKR